MVVVAVLGRDGSSRLGRSSRRRGRSGLRGAAHEEHDRRQKQEGKGEAASEDVGVGGEEGEVGERIAAALGARGLQEVLSAATEQHEVAVPSRAAAEDGPEQVEERNVLLPRNVPAPASVPATSDFHARMGSALRNRSLFFEGGIVPVLGWGAQVAAPSDDLWAANRFGAENHRKAGFLSRRSGARDLGGGGVVGLELRPATAGSKC